MAGFSRASKVNEAGAYSNGAVDQQCNYGNDIEQFGQLLATLLGNCHGSSEYNKVNVTVLWRNCEVFDLDCERFFNGIEPFSRGGKTRQWVIHVQVYLNFLLFIISFFMFRKDARLSVIEHTSLRRDFHRC